MTTLHGTHVFHPPGTYSKAEIATGAASASRQHLRAPLPTWMHDPHRGCHDRPTNWWFGGDKDDDGELLTDPEDAKTAERLCRACPFELDCGEFGLRNNEKFGMWGGIRLNTLTGPQRRERIAGLDRERRRRTA